MPIATEIRIDLGEHVVHFHEAGELDAVAEHLRHGFDDGDTIVVIASTEHRSSLCGDLPESDRVIVLDAGDTLDELLVAGRPDPARFDAVVGRLLRDLAASGTPVRAYGEMVGLLWEAGDVPGAIELERLWSALSDAVPFSLVCGYPAPVAEDERTAEAFSAVCDVHTGLVAGAPAPRAVDVSRRFGCTEHAPRLARELVRAVLGASPLTDDAVLVVTELSTNAVRHAGTDLTVSLTRSEDTVTIAVGDGSAAPPVRRALTPDAFDGRGLNIVAKLSIRWGHRRAGHGKLVWAELGAGGAR